jgi:hypothetical protein
MKLIKLILVWIFIFTLSSCFSSGSNDNGEMGAYQENPQETPGSEGPPPSTPNSSPTITISSPSAGIKYIVSGESITIDFLASDPDGETQVSFYSSSSYIPCSKDSIDEWTLIDTVSSSTYTYNWTVAESGIFYLCGEVNDYGGSSKIYNSNNVAIVSLPSNAQTWLSADYGVTADEDGYVSSWLDKSINTHNANQGELAYQPLLVNDAVKGKPVLRFDGENDFFKDEYTYNIRSVFAVLKVDSTLQQDTDLGQVFGDYTNGAHFALDARSSNLRGVSLDGASSTTGVYAINSSDFSSSISNSNVYQWAYDEFILFEVVFDEDKEISNQVIAHLAHTFGIGTHHLGADIAEIIVYDRELTSVERTTLRYYLNSRYLDETSNDPAVDPVNFTASSTSHSTIRLNWESGGSSTAGYIISYKEGSTAPSSCISDSIITCDDIGQNTTYLLSGLSELTQYSFRICAINADLPPDMSSGVSVSATTQEEQVFNPEMDNMILWLKADGSVVKDENNKVSQWDDENGLSISASQGDENYQAVLVENEINDLPVLRFDGVDDHMKGSQELTVGTVFVVFKISSTLQNTNHLAQLWGEYNAGTQVSCDARAGNLRGWSFDGNKGLSAMYALNDGAFSALVTNDNSVQWEYDTPTLVITKFSDVRTINEYSIATLSTPFNIGDYHYGGDIAEIIVYSTILSDEDILETKNYLANKWAIY